MPKKAHTEEQIVAVLRQGEAGEKVADICRKVGISEGTYYMWKKQYAGLGINELRELRQLREENGRLKRLVCAAFLDSAVGKGIFFSPNRTKGKASKALGKKPNSEKHCEAL